MPFGRSPSYFFVLWHIPFLYRSNPCKVLTKSRKLLTLGGISLSSGQGGFRQIARAAAPGNQNRSAHPLFLVKKIKGQTGKLFRHPLIALAKVTEGLPDIDQQLLARNRLKRRTKINRKRYPLCTDKRLGKNVKGIGGSHSDLSADILHLGLGLSVDMKCYLGIHSMFLLLPRLYGNSSGKATGHVLLQIVTVAVELTITIKVCGSFHI